MSQTSTGTILTFDIGGSNLKATVLSAEGERLQEYKKLPTPKPSTPTALIAALKELSGNFEGFEKISVGFPGYVRDGIVRTAPNLGNDLWARIPLADQLSDALGKPVRMVNDADLQGLGVVRGEGLEFVITLGTGFGTAFLLDGRLLPHLEIGQHPFTKTKNYDQYVGDKAFLEVGDERWNIRVLKVLNVLQTTFNYDHLYIGGGNAKKLNFDLDENMTLVSNKDGIRGGARLWA
ncbi:MAG: ROK family protein [Sphingobacteriaceae bacterium]|nr:ROK family protein [Cytophagaceae bacterium]